MNTKKVLIASAAVVVVASTAILAPSIATGVPLVPGSSLVSVEDGQPGDGPGENGQGKAWGHHKDSEDFPGKNGRGEGNPHNNPGND